MGTGRIIRAAQTASFAITGWKYPKVSNEFGKIDDWRILVMKRTSFFLSVAFALTLFFAASGSFAAKLLPAAEKLAEISMFAFGDVGRANHPSEGELRFCEVLRGKNALPTFYNILQRGTPAAKAYALCGIRVLAPGEFDTAAKSAAEPDVAVRTMSGCIIRAKKFSSLVAEIRNGNFDAFLEKDRKLP